MDQIVDIDALLSPELQEKVSAAHAMASDLEGVSDDEAAEAIQKLAEELKDDPRGVMIIEAIKGTMERRVMVAHEREHHEDALDPDLDFPLDEEGDEEFFAAIEHGDGDHKEAENAGDSGDEHPEPTLNLNLDDDEG